MTYKYSYSQKGIKVIKTRVFQKKQTHIQPTHARMRTQPHSDWIQGPSNLGYTCGNERLAQVVTLIDP